jgi:choline dehydrogenase-like flavoprotein
MAADQDGGGAVDTRSGCSTDCVVGSGPSGVACAAALLERGRRVHMLDAGIQLEPERAELVESLRRVSPNEWDPHSLRQLQAPPLRNGGLPDKLAYGSSFPYQGVEEHIGQVRDGVGLSASLAQGGLSTVWGAAMLACMEHDIEDWPITRQQLSAHYESVARLTRPSAGCDDLARLFPLYMEPSGPLQLSLQAQALWNNLERRREPLRKAGIHYGRSRLAIQTPQSTHGAGCVYCAMCMTGCPYGYIYSSANTVQELRRSERFTYQSDVVVRSVREAGDRVIVSGHHCRTRAPFEFVTGRVYLAAGAVSTTGILLRSLSAYERPLLMKDSQYFLLPVLLTGRFAVHEERRHTLSQIFLELIDPAVSRHTVHLQVYSYSDAIGQALRSAMGRFARPLEFVARQLEQRLLLLQGFVHSAESSEIAVTLRRPSAGREESLLLTAVPHPRAKRVVRRVVRRLIEQSPRLGVIPLPTNLQIAAPGRSFHFGGTFPMRANPDGFQTDVWGRPAGCRRIHAVDATVLPSIPATTITFTVMANAHRIGWQTAGIA